jgi:membrane associated rhomboid family serine protease
MEHCNTVAAQREPLFRGPWPAWTLALAVLGSYALQSMTLDLDTAARAWGMTPAELGGRSYTAVTALFVHGSWAHAGMNAIGALAFGAPVARYLGLGARGVIGFFALYIACGVAANLGYAAMHPSALMPLVGASGAVSGLFGAASRLIQHRPGLSPLTARTVVASAAAWVVVNAVLGLMHYAPGVGDVDVAWEAHIAGYAAGLLLIAPFAALLRSPVSEPVDPESPAENAAPQED